MDNKFCIRKKLVYLLSFLFILVVLVVAIGNSNKEKKPLSSRAHENKPSVPQLISASIISGNPLKQPYYDPDKSTRCETTKRLIEVYAGGISPDKCYKNVEENVKANLTEIKIFGRTVLVHNKAEPAFKAVADELAALSIDSDHIKNDGAYLFRCNSNASSGSTDRCSSDCLLSLHSFGIAIDINSGHDCNGCTDYTMPMEIVDIFEKYGFRWGGRYKDVFNQKIDPMHFEYMYDLCKE